MKRDGANIVETLHRFAIERLNVGERMVELQAGHADLICSQPIEHEGIIRVRAMGHGNIANWCRDRRRGHTYGSP